MTLDFYFLRRFLFSFLVMFGVIVLFVTLIDLVEQMRRSASIPLSEIMRDVALQLPINLSLFFPLIMLLSAIGFASNLSRNSEFVVAQAYGRSIARNLIGPAVGMFCIGIGVVAILNPLVAYCEAEILQQDRGAEAREGSVLSIGDNGVWVRLQADGGYIVLRADRVNGRSLEFIDVTVLRYDENSIPLERILAPRATLDAQGLWQMYGASVWSLESDSFSAAPKQNTVVKFKSDIEQQDLWEDLSSPSMISIWKLSSFIQTLRNSGFETAKHEAWQLKELMRPLFLMALGLIGALLSVRHFRAAGQAQSVVIGIGLGFSLHYMRDFSLILAENGQIQPLLGAASPILAAAFIAASLIVVKDVQT
jgi:lipopolysaccharide export system permease protein